MLATGLEAVSNVANAVLEHNTDSALGASLGEILATWTDLSDAEQGMSDPVLPCKGHPRLLSRSLIAEFGVCFIRIQKCYAPIAANDNTYIFGKLSKGA